MDPIGGLAKIGAEMEKAGRDMKGFQAGTYLQIAEEGGQIDASLPLFFRVAGDALGAFDVHRISPMLGILREACA